MTPDIFLLARYVLDLDFFFMGSVNIQELFLMQIFNFYGLTVLKLSLLMLDHVTKCLVTPCILLHGTPFPFSGN
jgi:hypothetical protein